MSNVLNRTTKEYKASVNTPEYPVAAWIINPDISAVASWPTKYWLISGDSVSLMNLSQRNTVDDDLFIATMSTAPTFQNLFGDGIDGDVTISSNTSLSRDLYPRILTVNAGIVLTTNGYRIFASRGIINNGTIQNNGASTTNQTGGVGGAAGTLAGGGAGATGLINLAGVNATNLNTSALIGYGGGGGAGGSSGGGSLVGGSGGIVLNDSDARVRPRNLENILMEAQLDVSVSGLIAQIAGGTGGGSGAGLIAILGSGGGGGGGTILVVSPYIYVSSTGIIQALGGNGADAQGVNTGGGGGGGGGIVATVQLSTLNRGSISAAGGSGGLKNGTGINGTNGASGKIISIDASSAINAAGSNQNAPVITSLLVPLIPESAQFLAANAATYNKINGTNFPISMVQFTAAALDEAYYKMFANGYTVGSLYVDVYWYPDSDVTAGHVNNFGASIAAITPGVDPTNIETKAFDTENTQVTAGISTNANATYLTTIIITNLDSLSSGDMIWVKLRLLTSGSTVTGETNVERVVVRYS